MTGGKLSIVFKVTFSYQKAVNNRIHDSVMQVNDW